MRIVSVITRLNIGGASPPVIALTVDLARRGHDAWLVVGTPGADEGSLEDEAKAEGAQVIQVPELVRNPHPLHDPRALTSLTSLFRRLRPDVVATHMSKAGALGRIGARLARVPAVVHTYHGKGFDVFRRGWRRSSALAMERFLAGLATGSIVVSEIQREEFTRLHVTDERKLQLIRYGIDMEPFLAAARWRGSVRAELGLTQDALLVGVIARLVWIKGQEVFVRAAAGLATRFPTARFLLVGDGDDRARLERMVADARLTNVVRFLGWRRDIPAVLADLDVVVLPTVMDFEGTPVALIEALAAARAVVATQVGGVAEVVRDGETGLLVPASDERQLAQAVAALLEDPTRRGAMGEAGRRLVVGTYSRARMVDETEAYFERLLAPARSPEPGA